MEYKGYLTYTQFNLSKKAGFELKIHKSCVAKIQKSCSFCHRFKIYTEQNDSASENIVMELSKSIINKKFVSVTSHPISFYIKRKTQMFGNNRIRKISQKTLKRIF